MNKQKCDTARFAFGVTMIIFGEYCFDLKAGFL